MLVNSHLRFMEFYAVHRQMTIWGPWNSITVDLQSMKFHAVIIQMIIGGPWKSVLHKE